MNEKLIEFVLAHENHDLNELLLRHKFIHGYPVGYVVNQINGRRRAKEKLPGWYSNSQILYPPQQNLEQCSSERTAEFKSKIIEETGLTGTLADLTGGFGVDSFYFSKKFTNVLSVDPDKELIDIASYNHRLLGAGNITYELNSAEQFLISSPRFDWLYIDPSRKSKGMKVFRFSDCEPDVINLLPIMLSRADHVLIKASPLLDIKAGLREMINVSKVYVVSVANDCKEVLFLLQRNFAEEPEMVAVNLESSDQPFKFLPDQEETSSPAFSDPDTYVYEPNASVLKAGAFKILSQRFSVNKLAVNTHLYTNREYKASFPGRVFKNLGGLTDPATQLSGLKANIISRNHPLTPDQIKKKYKLKDGGERYLLAFSGTRKKFLLVAERVK